MSHASRHVQWCLKKAEREIEECKEQGKRAKHRGLLKKEPDTETAKRHIEKAMHNLRAAQLLQKDYPDLTISTTFYATYHCFLAIAARFGYESGNQTCTIALMEWLKEEGKIDIQEEHIELMKYADEEDSIIDMREEYTYGIQTIPDRQKIEELFGICKEIIDTTKEIIYS